ncbi:hypothetical protein E4U43_004775 [Claviceps pusilla]|uniref:Uncharacterized protein n=1 Tax=Claviceps pusilla TaxID=123648 RepID=A0A9P7NGV2_9HYPO|nr:hypothetical protein E4U43_004775 [Claviceps pusilla]
MPASAAWGWAPRSTLRPKEGSVEEAARKTIFGDKELDNVEKLIWRLDEERMRKDSGGAGRSGKTSPS